MTIGERIAHIILGFGLGMVVTAQIFSLFVECN